MKVIAIIENDEDYLEALAQRLEIEDYRVLRISTLKKAKKKLNDENVHMAIFDIRMIDDDDFKDKSGLLFAQKSEYKAIPKIILTSYPTLGAAKEALCEINDGTKPAIEFLSKEDNTLEIISRINKAFEKYVPINWDLDIKWDPLIQSSFKSLTLSIIPERETLNIDERVDEIKDVFKKYFYNSNEIIINGIIINRYGKEIPYISFFVCDTNNSARGSCILIGSKCVSFNNELKNIHSIKIINILESMHFIAALIPCYNHPR